MSDNLTDRLDALDASADFSDPTTYSKLLGYDEAPAAEAAPVAQEVKGETVTPAAAPAAAPATESSAAPAAAEKTETEAAGIATKDGKHVIPMSVLTDTRTALQKANQRAQELAEANQRLTQQLEAKQANPEAATPEAVAITAEELSALEADFPEQAAIITKLVKANEALQAQVQEVAARPAATAAQAQEVNLQELIDQRPLLSQWQAKGGLAWGAAVEADEQLEADPAWATKPIGERFAEVERRIAAEFGIPVVAPATPPTPEPAKTPAAPVVTTVAPTLTDFNGTPASVGDPMAGMPVGKMVDQAMNMDMESLRRMAGLSY